MSKRIWFAILIFLGLVAASAPAQSLVPLDPAAVTNGDAYLMDSLGANLPDDSPTGVDGTLIGSPTLAPGLNGNALQLNGTSDGVLLPDAATINNATHQNHTVIAVFNCADVTKPEKQCVFEEGGSTRGLTIYVDQGLVYAAAWNRADYTPQWNPGTFLSAPIGSNEWHVVAAVLRNGTAAQEDDKFEMWMDGKLIGKGPGGQLQGRTDDNGIGNVQQQTNFHDGTVNAGYWFGGLIDELWILDEALPEDVLSAMGISPANAKSPVPDHGVADVPRDSVLSWEAGEFARTHDVYLGTTFADVNTASRTDARGVLAGQGQTATEFVPPSPLEFGQTYFWRIDEVNGAPDNTIFKGEVWSFTVEPYAYPITQVTATASSYQVDMEPEKTIDGSGMTGGRHDTVETTMWLSAGAGPNWIQYEFDKVYMLHDLQVWNSNQVIEPFLGFGAKDVTIETSADGATWTAVPDVPQFAQATGTPDYAANTTVSLGGAEAQFVKLTINSNWGGVAPQVGLSEVQFSYVPVRAREPMPADGAAQVSVDTDLNWRPGREATSHRVFFGTDSAGVADATAAAETVTEHSFTPSALDLWTTYFWRVDELNATTYVGDVWSFTTQEYLVVDDFESYTDQAGEEIFSTWIDGFADQSSGSTVGLLTAVNGTFGETTIVHSGKQSMPLAYDNTSAPQYSEAKLTFATPQDWTARGIKSLSLWFQGAAGNGGQLYVKINSTKIAYDGDAADLARAAWQVWNIDLSQAGNVGSVRTLTIGVEGAGTQGTLYIDDIRLYPKTPEYITPVQPADTGLAAHYTFDEGSGTRVGDSSGNGNHGTVNGNPQWVAGKIGGAMAFDGAGDFVDCGQGASLVIRDTITVSCWIKVASFTRNWEAILAMGDDSYRMSRSATTGNSIHFGCNGPTGGNLDATTEVTTDTWRHVALVYDGAYKIIYIDGVEDARVASTGQINVSAYNLHIGDNSQQANRELQGVVDDVRIYSRPLSPAEVAGLAGVTKPLAKPF